MPSRPLAIDPQREVVEQLRARVAAMEHRVAAEGREAVATFGYAAGARPRSRRFVTELADEVERMRLFLRGRNSGSI